MSLLHIIIGAFSAALLLLWILWRNAKAKATKLNEQKKSLETQNHVLQTRVNNNKERRNNEENANSRTRDELIDSMQQSKDLRD